MFKRSRSRSNIMHPRDAERFARPGGMLQGKRFYNDPPPAAADWRASLPEDIRNDPALADFKDVGSLAKSYRDTKAFVGSSIRPPGPDASPEARKEFREKLAKHAPDLIELPSDPAKLAEVENTIFERLGRPKDAKEYAPKQGAEVTEDELGKLRQLAQKRGYTKKQFDILVDDFTEQKAASAKALADGQAALKTEWGSAYDQNLAKVRGVLEQTTAPQELKDAVAQGKVTPALAKWLSGLATSLGAQPREVSNQNQGPAVRITPTEALAQLAEIEGREEYFNPSKNMDEHRRLVERHTALLEHAYPDIAAQGRNG